MKSGSDLTESDKLGYGEEKSGSELEKSLEKSGPGKEKSGSGKEKSREAMDSCDPLVLRQEMSDRSRGYRSPAMTSKALVQAMGKLSKESRKNYFSKKNSELAHPVSANDDLTIKNPNPDTDQVVLKPDTQVGPIGQYLD
jgi:hypothetical protein